MFAADKMFDHEERWRVSLTGKIGDDLMHYFDMTTWLNDNSIVWRIANKDTLEFDLRDDAMMFFLRFK